MELMFKLNDGERLNNFTVAEAIYNACTSKPYMNELDADTIASMLREQYYIDKLNKNGGED